MLLDEKMDHGPILSQARISPEDDSDKSVHGVIRTSELEEILANVGGELLVETILGWMQGDITPEEQNHAQATYCHIIKKEDALLNLNDDPYQNFLKIQAFDAWPVAYFFVTHKGKSLRVKVASATYENDTLHIQRVIPEGKKEMDYADFLRGLQN